MTAAGFRTVHIYVLNAAAVTSLHGELLMLLMQTHFLLISVNESIDQVDFRIGGDHTKQYAFDLGRTTANYNHKKKRI